MRANTINEVFNIAKDVFQTDLRTPLLSSLYEKEFPITWKWLRSNCESKYGSVVNACYSKKPIIENGRKVGYLKNYYSDKDQSLRRVCDGFGVVSLNQCFLRDTMEMDKQVVLTICHELIHIYYPKLDEGQHKTGSNYISKEYKDLTNYFANKVFARLDEEGIF